MTHLLCAVSIPVESEAPLPKEVSAPFPPLSHPTRHTSSSCGPSGTRVVVSGARERFDAANPPLRVHVDRTCVGIPGDDRFSSAAQDPRAARKGQQQQGLLLSDGSRRGGLEGGALRSRDSRNPYCC
eukprot:scaffold1100_cov254-Pinguiococcus_pyrenoidosus.AAC.5